MSNQVIIAGGGIGGLTMALTLHQIGVPCIVVESSPTMRPMGVGINIQPNAVRELIELGITHAELNAVGVQCSEWALVGLQGHEIYSEPRGMAAGYKWPQYSLHRGALQMLLYEKVLERLGSDSVMLGTQIVSYQPINSGVKANVKCEDGSSDAITGCSLIGADGIHSATRAQMHSDQPPIHWGGSVMWRGTVRAKPLRSGSSFVGLGTRERRMIIYPISPTDADGFALINWIAEITVDSSDGWHQEGWFRPTKVSEFVHHFKDFHYAWLDVPDMLSRADCAYENPMIDRDPVATWVDGPVALLGDAAHAMYPTGSNGASQAIVDARVVGAKMLEHGVTAAALAAYNADLCAPISKLVLRNRGDGPFGLLKLVDERCGGVFNNINEIISESERVKYMADYKKAAGFAMDQLNVAQSTIPRGAKVSL